MIKVNNVSFTYPNGYTALKDVTLTFDLGKIYLVMGSCGAGKTTLAKVLNGLLKPSKGEVLIDGVSTRKLSVAAICKKVGLVFQNPERQFFAMTVWEEVAFGPRNLGLNGEPLSQAVDNALSAVSLKGFDQRSPWSLSGGEMKRLAIASILAMNPKYIILDEPTIGQDYKSKLNISKIIRRLRREGKCIIVITHDVEWAFELEADELILLCKGKVVDRGVPYELFSKPGLLAKSGLSPPIIVELTFRLVQQGILSSIPAKFSINSIGDDLVKVFESKNV